MKNLFKTLIFLIIFLSPIFSQTQDSATLKMPDGSKTVNLYFNITDNDNIFSESAIISAVKLRLRQNGIKYHPTLIRDNIHGYLFIRVHVFDVESEFVYSYDVQFIKNLLMSVGDEARTSQIGDMVDRGKTIHSSVVVYGTSTNMGLATLNEYQKRSTIDGLLQHIDKFSADFLDANDL